MLGEAPDGAGFEPRNRASGGPLALVALAELLGEQGYATLGFVAVDWLGPGFGLNRGFQRQFTEFDGRVSVHRKEQDS